MIRKVSYESQERREKQVLAALNANGNKSLEEANQICEDAGVDPYQMCEDTQRICFEELLCDVTLCQLEVTCTLSYSTVESTSL